MLLSATRSHNRCPVCTSLVIPNSDKTLKFCSERCYEEYCEVLNELHSEYARDDYTSYESKENLL